MPLHRNPCPSKNWSVHLPISTVIQIFEDYLSVEYLSAAFSVMAIVHSMYHPHHHSSNPHYQVVTYWNRWNSFDLAIETHSTHQSNYFSNWMPLVPMLVVIV